MTSFPRMIKGTYITVPRFKHFFEYSKTIKYSQPSIFYGFKIKFLKVNVKPGIDALRFRKLIKRQMTILRGLAKDLVFFLSE